MKKFKKTENTDTEEITDGAQVKKVGMVKKQKIMIIVFASVFVVLTILYFAVFYPIMKDKSEKEPFVPPALIEGEAYDMTGSHILMIPHIDQKNLKSVEVHNSYETYTCKRAEKDGFYIVEHPQAPIGAEKFTSFVVDAGYTVVNRRITEKCEDLSLYGLAPEDNPAYYIITSIKDESYKIYLGDRLQSGGGYYAKVDGRDAVYVVSASREGTLLAPSNALFTPILGYPVPQNKYQEISEVILSKNGEPFIYVTYEKTNPDEFVLSAYKMQYPANYIVNDDNYATVMLASFINLSGTTVLEAGGADYYLRNDEEVMASYGFYDIYNMPYELYYSYDGTTTAIAFADSGVDGYYFAYSYLYDMIVLVETKTVPYLDWDLIDYVNSALFAEYINDVSEITVEGKLKKDGQIYDINEKFTIKSVQAGTTTAAIGLECFAHSTGKTFKGTRPSGNPVQSFYGTVLAMKIQGYIKTEGVDVSTLPEYAKLTIKMTDGKVRVYRFYRYSERCYYTVDGEGEFYIALKDVNKLLIDSVRAAYGMSVTKEEYPTLPEEYTDKYK